MAWKPDYVSSAELKDFLRISDTVDDTEIGFAISAASRAVDNHTHRQFGAVAATEERIYTGEWDRRTQRWIITIDDLMNDTITITNDDAEAIDVYRLHPVNAEQKARPWTMIVVDPDAAAKPTGSERLVTIGAVWGWTAVPTAVKQATLLQASRFFNRRTSPYGVAGSPDTGSELRLLERVDPDVGVALADYVRRWGAV